MPFISMSNTRTLQVSKSVTAASAEGAALTVSYAGAPVHAVGDIVSISGTTGTTSANGIFAVTVVTGTGPTVLSLQTLSGQLGYSNASWISGGTIKHIGFQLSALADNTVVTSTPAFATFKTKVSGLATGVVARVAWFDAADSAFLTTYPGPCFIVNGGGPVDGTVDSAGIDEWPDARFGSAGNYLGVNVIVDGAVGSSVSVIAQM